MLCVPPFGTLRRTEKAIILVHAYTVKVGIGPRYTCKSIPQSLAILYVALSGHFLLSVSVPHYTLGRKMYIII